MGSTTMVANTMALITCTIEDTMDTMDTTGDRDTITMDSMDTTDTTDSTDLTDTVVMATTTSTTPVMNSADINLSIGATDISNAVQLVKFANSIFKKLLDHRASNMAGHDFVQLEVAQYYT